MSILYQKIAIFGTKSLQSDFRLKLAENRGWVVKNPHDLIIYVSRSGKYTAFYIAYISHIAVNNVW